MSWFLARQGIDTGPILLQAQRNRFGTRTRRLALLHRLFPLGIETMVEAIELIMAGGCSSDRAGRKLATTNRRAATSTPKSISRGARAKSSTWCADANPQAGRVCASEW